MLKDSEKRIVKSTYMICDFTYRKREVSDESMHNNRGSNNKCISNEVEWSGLVCDSMSAAADRK